MRGVRPNGFTLTETMVVIGVIVLLVSLVTPALGMLRKTSLSTQCSVTLRQLHGGITAWRNINKDLLPNAEPLPVLTPDGPVGGLNAKLKGFIDPECECWRCAADDSDDVEQIHTSYLYMPGLLVLTLNVQLALPPDAVSLPPAIKQELEARLVTVFYEGEAHDTVPVLIDSEDRHTYGDRNPRNGLYFDGSVRILRTPPSNQTQD